MTASDKLLHPSASFMKCMTYINNDYRTEHNKFELLTFNFKTLRKERKGHGVWPSMVSRTQNLCSAFNPSTHPSTKEGFCCFLMAFVVSYVFIQLLVKLTDLNITQMCTCLQRPTEAKVFYKRKSVWSL